MESRDGVDTMQLRVSPRKAWEHLSLNNKNYMKGSPSLGTRSLPSEGPGDSWPAGNAAIRSKVSLSSC